MGSTFHGYRGNVLACYLHHMMQITCYLPRRVGTLTPIVPNLPSDGAPLSAPPGLNGGIYRQERLLCSNLRRQRAQAVVDFQSCVTTLVKLATFGCYAILGAPRPHPAPVLCPFFVVGEERGRRGGLEGAAVWCGRRVGRGWCCRAFARAFEFARCFFRHVSRAMSRALAARGLPDAEKRDEEALFWMCAKSRRGP